MSIAEGLMKKYGITPQEVSSLAKPKPPTSIPVLGEEMGPSGMTIGGLQTKPKEELKLEREIRKTQLLTAKKNLATIPKTDEQKMKRAADIAEAFAEKISELPRAKGLGGRISGIASAIPGMTQQDPQVAAYQSSLDGMAVLMVKALGDVGAISEADKEPAKKLLANPQNNYETNAEKILFLQTVLGKIGADTSSKSMPFSGAYTSDYRKSSIYKKGQKRKELLLKKYTESPDDGAITPNKTFSSLAETLKTLKERGATQAELNIVKNQWSK